MTFDDLYNSIITDWTNKLNITVAEAGYDIIIMSKVKFFKKQHNDKTV